MADLGHELTDKILDGLEEKIADEYALAARDMHKKLAKYLEKFEIEKAKQKALLDAGKITQKEYKDWCYRHIMTGKRWREMRDTLAEDLAKTKDIALKISREQMADVYALNANYAMYEIEHGGKINTGFTLYNHDTAEYLLKEQRQLMPVPSTKRAAEIAADKALQWDMQRIQSAVLQGVLQGESPFDVAKRLRGVAQMDYNASIRYARTMTTSAQNAGRYEAFHRAKKLGVHLTIEWQATLDNRTRHDHRLMHGQRRDVDEPFKLPSGQEILYPADSRGNSYALQGEIWNCRCTLLSWVKGFEGDTVKESPKMGEMTFDEWQDAKKDQKAEPEPPAVVKTPNVFANIAGLDEDFTQGMSDLLASCERQEVKDIFGKYADELVCRESDLKRGAFFRRADGGVHFNAANVKAGNDLEKPFEVAFHEFGHMVDWLANGKEYDYLSNTELGGLRLLDVLKKDFRAFKKTCGVTRAPDVINVLQAENLPKAARGNISDILEKMTGVSYPLGIGHGTDYHRRDGATEKEFFAEVLDSVVANPEGYAQMQRIFPNGVEFVFNLIKGVR